MPVWASILLWKVLLPDLIVWLQQHGYMNVAEELMAKGAVDVVNEIKTIKTYPEYPVEKGAIVYPEATTNISNVNYEPH